MTNLLSTTMANQQEDASIKITRKTDYQYAEQKKARAHCPCFPEAHLSKTLWNIVHAKNFLSATTTESTRYKNKNGPMS